MEVFKGACQPHLIQPTQKCEMVQVILSEYDEKEEQWASVVTEQER